MASIKELKAKVKATSEAYREALRAMQAAEDELKAAEKALLEKKMAACDHSETKEGSTRTYEGKGFYDTWYTKCTKCGKTLSSHIDNIVLDSGAWR